MVYAFGVIFGIIYKIYKGKCFRKNYWLLEGMLLEELYREESSASSERKIIAVVALFIIFGLLAYEGYGYYTSGRINPLGWGMDLCFLALWVWRVVFNYTLILYKNHQLEVISHGLGIHRSYMIDLTRTESFTNRYVKSFFRKTKISHYIHRYNSLDSNPQRLLVFTEGKKNRLAGLLFKASDEFVKQLHRQMPDKYIEL